MKFKTIFLLCFSAVSLAAHAEKWEEVYRQNAKDASGATYLIDRDSIRVNKRVVFFKSKTEEHQTRKISHTNLTYDYQIGTYAVNCSEMSMTGLGNAFYQKGGRLVGDDPVDEDSIFDKGRVIKSKFDKIEDPDSPWAAKINYICRKHKGRGIAKK